VSWLQIRVKPGRDRESVIAALFAAGAPGVQEIGDDLQTHLPAEGTDVDALTCAVLAASAGASLDVAPAPDVDWSEAWKHGIGAQELGAITIAPPWLAGKYDPDRLVVIDPGMAFGTGEHATTRGVVRLLPRVLHEGDRVADLGAGSAVLSIAAAKLGAAHVVAIEIDPDAIPNAEENVERNGVADRVVVLQGDAGAMLPLVSPVRLVLANIISSVLVELLPAIAAALSDDGHAILSGILQSERDDLVPVLEGSGWTVQAEDREDIWWSAVIARA